MDIPETTKSEKRLILTLGRHQNKDEPLNMTELCEKIEQPLQALQRGKPGMVSGGFVNKEREHPATMLTLTESGDELYEVLEDYLDALR